MTLSMKAALSCTPIPARMAHLPRDKRGFPIPANVLLDDAGMPHFTINDEETRQRFIKEDRCPICAGKLHRGRWSVGGPLSAFHPDGRYMDTPMHYECCAYALRVCPYLAMPSYTKRLEGRTLNARDPGTIAIPLTDPTVIPDRPSLFVAVMHVGQTYTRAPWGVRYIIPNRPYRNIEYWQNGSKMDPAEGKALADTILENFLNSDDQTPA